jgi:hypothetical protein
MRTLRFKSVLNLSGQDFYIRRLAPTAGDHFATYGMCTVRYQLFRDAYAHAITQVISHTSLRGRIQRWLTEMGRPRDGNVVGRASGDARVDPPLCTSPSLSVFTMQ